MASSKFIQRISKETRTFLCAFACFALMLLIGTWTIGDCNTPPPTSEVFSMYHWHYGNSSAFVSVADVFGTNIQEDNELIHVRKEIGKDTEVILWNYDNGLNRENYSAYFLFGDTTFTRSCRFVINNEGKEVLYIDKPKKVVDGMTNHKEFSISIISGCDTDRYDYNTGDALKWNKF